MELRPQLVVEIRKLNSIEQCPLCNRILVLEALVIGESDKKQDAQS
jgi:predicted  nucleic acid-binding Zn-ribbon protein